MTTILDDRQKISQLDTANMLGSIESFPQQLIDSWEQVSNINFSTEYQKAKNITLIGMGGSALSGYVVRSLYAKELAVPLTVSHSYHLPAYINENSLVILSSYSGNTEEVLQAASEATKAGAKIIAITEGGELAKLADHHKWPLHLIKARYNPSGQPRMAVGYTLISLLAIFTRLGYLNITEELITKLADNLKQMSAKLTVEQQDKNSAKLLAYQAYDKLVILVGAEHLQGAVHVTNNQLNENAKVLTAEWPLSEFNHHYLEALSHPDKLREDVIFLLYNSYQYDPQMQKRVALTHQIITEAGYQAEIIQATAPSRVEQVFEIILLGSYLSYYLSMLYGIDPSPIPNVDKLKKLL